MFTAAHLTARLVAFVALTLFLGECGLQAGEDTVPAPRPPPSVTDPNTPKTDTPPGKMSANDVMSGLDWSATKQSFPDEKGAVVLSGSAWIRFQGIKLEADNIVFYRQTREMYAEGFCRLRVGESEMSASAVYIDVDSATGYLVDAVVKVTAPGDSLGAHAGSGGKFGIKEDTTLHKEPLVGVNKHLPLAGDEISTFRARDQYGVYVTPSSDPQARASLLLKAEKLVRNNELHYTTENAFITNDEMAHPIYGVQADQLDFWMKKAPDPLDPEKMTLRPSKVVAKGARLQFFGFNLFKFPTVTYDLDRKREYFSFHQGQSGRWGHYVLTRFGYGMGGDASTEQMTKPFQMTHVYFDLDERTRRGPALGVELAWQTAGYQVHSSCPGSDRSYWEYGTGHVRGYGEYEIQINTRDDIARARRDLERRIQPKIDGFQRISFDANQLFLKRRKLDNAGPPSFAIQAHEDDVRGMVEFQEHIPIKRLFGIENIYVDVLYERQSDRDFMLEFFPRNYNQQNQSEALVSARKACDNWSMEFLYRTNPERFDSSPPRSPVDYGTFTGYEPALTYTYVPTNIGLGVYMSGEAQAAHMRRYFERAIYDQPNFDADRLSGRVDFKRPFDLCFMTVTPHLGTQQALYDNSRDAPGGFVGRESVKGSSLAQGAMFYGIDFDSRIYGTYSELCNEELGLKGLRHIVEPRFSFQGVSNTYHDPAKVLDFDETDDLIRKNVMTFSVDQTVQTRRPPRHEGEGERTVSVAGFDTALDVYPSRTDRERLLGGDMFGMLRLDGFFRVLDVVRFDGGVGFNPQNFSAETAQFGMTIDPHERWKLKFGERYSYNDHTRAITGSDQFRVQFEYELSDRWAIGYEQIFEKKKSLQIIKGRQVERFELTRHYGPFDAMIGYSVDRNLGDHGFYGAVRPTIVSRNLILAENDPLVNPAQVSGETEEPETRNFDPFQILRKQRLKSPPKAGDVRDVPAPPPSQDPNASKNAPDPKGETVDLRKVPSTPAAPKPPKKAAPVDADEWTLPASVPTSVRQ